MQRIARDLARKYAFDWRDEPLLHVEPGEAFVSGGVRMKFESVFTQSRLADGLT